MALSNGILAMNPDKYREMDGVVFDLNSYARHCQPSEPEVPAEEPAVPAAAAPAPVFAVDPFHAGWYEAEEGQAPVPIMGGFLPPDEACAVTEGAITVTRTVFVRPGSGSGSGSSYTTSYTTSYRISYLGSGSGSYVFGSCVYLAGGYGLELI